MGEYDGLDELGLTHDKQLICGCKGFLQTNDSTRDLCGRFIQNGEKFYDLVTRYDDMVAYVLNRDGGRSGSTVKFVAPFLKAFGATDYTLHQCCDSSLRVMPEAGKVMRYLMNLLPTFISTSSYEHNVMALCDRIGMSRELADCSQVSLDDYDLSRQEGRTLREFASQITSLRLPRHEYELNVPLEMEECEIALITAMDRIFDDKIGKMDANRIMTEMKSVGANEKAYTVLDIRKRTLIDLEGTAYIGGDMIDYPALDLVKDGGGLSIAFNGSEFAVHGCNIAVMSRDCTVAAVLVQEFYNEGTEAALDLANNWDRKTLEKRDCPDRHLMDAMLLANPRKLPEVHVIDRSNVTEIGKKSDRYRKKLFL